jgi:hypothetical protein
MNVRFFFDLRRCRATTHSANVCALFARLHSRCLRIEFELVTPANRAIAGCFNRDGRAVLGRYDGTGDDIRHDGVDCDRRRRLFRFDLARGRVAAGRHNRRADVFERDPNRLPELPDGDIGKARSLAFAAPRVESRAKRVAGDGADLFRDGNVDERIDLRGGAEQRYCRV